MSKNWDICECQKELFVYREETIKRLQEQFDVLIIGGGITVVGAARDAAHRNLKT